MLDGGHSVLRLVCFSFLPPDVFSIHKKWPNTSNFVSSDHRMVDQKRGSCFRWPVAKARRASRCFFLSSGVFRGLRPWRSPLCKTHSMVDRDTFVPAWSRVSIRALVVVRGLMLTSRQIFLASVGDTLRFLPRPLRFLTVLNIWCLLIMLWTVATGTSYCFEMALYITLSFTVGTHKTLT